MKSSPSQSRRENVPSHTNIGCMAGIFHFLSKYHPRRRFLTSGEKQVTNKQRENSFRKRKCRSNVKNKNKSNSVQKTTKIGTGESPSLLENVIPPPPVAIEVEAETMKRTLEAALKKCDEDLKAISSIINTLRSNDQKLSSSPNSMKSAFRHFNSSHSLSLDRSSSVANAHIRKKGVVVQQKRPQPRKDCFQKVISRFLVPQTTKVQLWSRKSKIKIVNEVCNDLIWGIEREFGKIVLVLEDHIFKYLINEFVKELIGDSAYLSFPTIYHIIPKARNARTSCTELSLVVPSLPLEACKRRLSF